MCSQFHSIDPSGRRLNFQGPPQLQDCVAYVAIFNDPCEFSSWHGTRFDASLPSLYRFVFIQPREQIPVWKGGNLCEAD